MRPYRFPTLPALLIASAVAATGCGKSGDTDSATDRDTEQAATQQEEQPAEPAEPALPKVDYWKPVVAAMQGEYRQNCAEGLERKPTADTVKIAADGKVTVGGVNFHPRDGKTTLMRTAPGKQAEGVSLIYEAGEVALTLNNFGPGAADHVTVNYSGKGLSCNNVSDVLRLDGRPLFTTFAEQFTVKPRRIACTAVAESMVTKPLDFVLEGKQLKLGEQVFDLDKITSEIVLLEDGSASYSVVAEPQRSAVVLFDQYGRLSHVTVTGFDNGPSYACVNLEQQNN